MGLLTTALLWFRLRKLFQCLPIDGLAGTYSVGGPNLPHPETSDRCFLFGFKASLLFAALHHRRDPVIQNHAGGGLPSNLMPHFFAIEACSTAIICPFICASSPAACLSPPT